MARHDGAVANRCAAGVVLLLLLQSNAFLLESESEYLSLFPSLIADSHSAVPLAVTSACSTASDPISDSVVTLPTGSVSSATAQSMCDSSTTCVVPLGSTLEMCSSLNVGTVVVQGSLSWSDATQASNTVQYLCAGYVFAEAGGIINITVQEEAHTAVVYVKDNGASHGEGGVRVFGGEYANVTVSGRPMARTWSLLAEPAVSGSSTLTLLHSPEAMGWRIGDRVAIAPTDTQTAGTGVITALSSTAITLSSPTSQIFSASRRVANPDLVSHLAAEVINLSRNVLVTGDEFRHVPCGTDGCECSSSRTTCTFGLHTALRHGGVLRMSHTRVERCGQRGVMGRYCMHMHQLGVAPDSVLHNNAIEFSMQRGIVIHGTHLSTTTGNVLFDVRGAGIYIEDGNEFGNAVTYNVAVCPWGVDDARHGCSIPGTDNGQSDTALNQAGIWSLSSNNHLVGNRMANSFNGMLFEASAFGGNGRGAADGRVCTSALPIGRLYGNTFHNHRRFGTYLLVANFPRQTDVSLADNGFMTDLASSCAAYLPDGLSNGLGCVVSHNTDYNNVFVGQYDAGDIQYRHHASLSSNNLIYWKTTKSFQDGCSSHISGSGFSDGTMALPDGDAVIISNTTFSGYVTLEANHHCNVGVTGVLCSPTYVLDEVDWSSASTRWMYFHKSESDFSLFVLPPPEEPNPTGDGGFFPASFSAATNPRFDYLLSFDSTWGGGSTAACELAGDATPGGNNRYSGAILCRPRLRMLKLLTRGLTTATAPRVVLELWRDGGMVTATDLEFHAIGGTSKQGFSVPVVPNNGGLTHSYHVKVVDGGGAAADVPSDWAILFSDPTFGNRWEVDEVTLSVEGWTCPATTTSQHDRRFLLDPTVVMPADAIGHGACQPSQPDMPAVDCSAQPDLALPDCTGVGDADLANCAPMCATDCGAHGVCISRFLGGSLPVSSTVDECLCVPPYTGPSCDLDPCSDLGEDCSGHGTCVPTGVANVTCTCDAGWTGSQCDASCSGSCVGEFPFGCAATDSRAFHWCGPTGGCAYSDSSDDGPGGWCMYKGDDRDPGDPAPSPAPSSPPTNGSAPISPTPLPGTGGANNPCDDLCLGGFPFGCNQWIDEPFHACNGAGGCWYGDSVVDTPGGFCLYRGYSPTPSPSPTPSASCPGGCSRTASSSATPTKSPPPPCDAVCGPGSWPYSCNPSIDQPVHACLGSGCSYVADEASIPFGWCVYKRPPSPSSSPSSTPSSTPSPTLTPSSTSTPSPSPSLTPSPFRTPSPSATPSRTSTPSMSPSPPPTNPGVDEDDPAEPGCFTSSGMVQREDGADVSVSALQPGDRVWGVDAATGSRVVDEVFRVFHHDAVRKAEVLRLSTASGHSLEVTGTHFLHVNTCCSPASVTQAADAAVGDLLFVVAGASDDATPSAIVSIERVPTDGLYNVHTRSSNLVVNGVAVSHFTTNSVWVWGWPGWARAWVAPWWYAAASPLESSSHQG